MHRSGRLFSLLLLLALSFSVSLPLHAEEEGGAKPASKGEGGEGGGEKDKKGGASDVSGGRFAGDPIYVHLAPMLMPIITQDGVEQLVTLVIDIQVVDFDTADNLHSNMPRVMDALLRNLYGGLGQGSLRNGKLVDVTKVKTKATAAIGTIVPPDSIREVLIQGVAQRML